MSHAGWAVALALHVLSAVVWVGGMFFAYVALRPAVGEVLAGIQDLQLWSRTFERFFRWVWVAVVLLPLTGYWMVYSMFGNLRTAGVHVELMQGIGWFMILLFLHLYFAPYRRLKRALAEEDSARARQSLRQIRAIVAANLALGLTVVVIASAGRLL